MRSGGIKFTFDGISSDEYGLLNLSASSGGLSTDSFSGDLSIKEDSIEGRDAPYFYGVKRSPMSFAVRFAFSGGVSITEQKLDEVTSWLIQDSYKPLIFSDNPDKIYYVIFSGTPSFVHNGAKSGYFTLNARNMYPYPVINDLLTGDYTISASEMIVVVNPGSFSVIPNINLIVSSSGDNTIYFKNLSNGSELQFTVNYNDEIEIDGFNKIATNLTTGFQFRLDKRWMFLNGGNNSLYITGDFVFNMNFKSGIHS